jgi:hypothetical protein
MRIKIAETRATMATNALGITTPGAKILRANKIKKTAKSMKPMFLVNVIK